MPRGIPGSGTAVARSGTTAMLGEPISAPASTMTTSSPAQSGVIWTSATYRFIQQAGGLIVEMEQGSTWTPVPAVPVSVLEQFLMTRGFLKPMLGMPLPHASNGAGRVARNRTTTTTARSGTRRGGRAAAPGTNPV